MEYYKSSTVSTNSICSYTFIPAWVPSEICFLRFTPYQTASNTLCKLSSQYDMEQHSISINLIEYLLVRMAVVSSVVWTEFWEEGEPPHSSNLSVLKLSILFID